MQNEATARSKLTLHLDTSTVGRHDVVTDRQAEARASARRLGGEEGIEQAVEVFRRDAFAGIGDLYLHLAFGRRGSDADLVALDRTLLHRLSRVDHEVDEYLR